MDKNIKISIVLLNFNREFLLRNAFYSILATTKSGFEIIIVDNHSTDGSRMWMKKIFNQFNNVKMIFLEENLGGEAINLGIEQSTGDYIYISENDLEYFPSWDRFLQIMLDTIPNLGLVSPLSPYPDSEFGEIWVEKKFEKEMIQDKPIYFTLENIGTSCMFRRDIWDKGVRWSSINSDNGETKFPADGKFSKDVRGLGYKIAWSEKSQVINWGHNERVYNFEKEYYKKNWKAKSQIGIDGLEYLNEGADADYSKLVSLIQENQNLKNENQNLKTLLNEPSQEVLSLSNTIHFYKYQLEHEKKNILLRDRTIHELEVITENYKKSRAYKIGKILLYPLWLSRKFFYFFFYKTHKNE